MDKSEREIESIKKRNEKCDGEYKRTRDEMMNAVENERKKEGTTDEMNRTN